MTIHQDDPLDRVLFSAIEDSDALDFLLELMNPSDPGTAPVKPAQIRAALQQHGHLNAPFVDDFTYETTTETCRICGTAQQVQHETGPHPTTGERITISRWVRHAHPVMGSACCDFTTWQTADQ